MKLMAGPSRRVNGEEYKKHVYYSLSIVAKKVEGVTAINKLLTNLIRAVISVNDDQSLEKKIMNILFTKS